MNHDASMTTSIISDKSKSALHLCFYHIYSSIVDLILDKQKKKEKTFVSKYVGIHDFITPVSPHFVLPLL